MKKSLALFVCVTLGLCLMVRSGSEEPEHSDYVKRLNIPDEARELFRETGLDKEYEFSLEVNPFYLRGDFSGDGEADLALLVEERASKKLGIGVIHHGESKVFFLGAGHAIGSGGDDFQWMTNWEVRRKGTVGQGADEGPPPSLKGEAIYVAQAESASGLIYWNGSEYDWYQQGI